MNTIETAELMSTLVTELGGYADSNVERAWPDSAAVQFTQAQRVELDSRIADRLVNPDDVLSWDTIKSSIVVHLKK